MNERIYEFATRAGAYCETYLHGGDPKPPVLDNMDLEKFAQLIVLECARWLGNREFASPEALKQHFGVE
mgnify:CR=1 FL=1